jgi:hypothetical protein
MKNATMLYKCPGPHEIHGGHFDTIVVDADAEGALEAAIADGWHLTTPAALEASHAPKEPDDNAPPTRDELIAKAKELGLTFGPNTASKKLGEMIEAKLLEDAAALALQQAGA